MSGLRFLMLGLDGMHGAVAHENDLLNMDTDPYKDGWHGTYDARTHYPGAFAIFNWFNGRPWIGSTLATTPGWTSVLTGTDPRDHHMLAGSAKYAPLRRQTGIDSFQSGLGI